MSMVMNAGGGGAGGCSESEFCTFELASSLCLVCRRLNLLISYHKFVNKAIVIV